MKGDVEAVGKLRFLASLRFFYCVPKCFSVCILSGRMRGKQNFRTDDAALIGVVAVLAVMLAVQFFAGTIGSRSDNGLSFAAFDLVNMKMIQCDNLFPLCFAYGGHAADGVPHLVHVEDMIQQLGCLCGGQVLNCRCDTF